MPIKPQHRLQYPFDWPIIAAAVKLGRAKGRCECCRRRHGDRIRQLPDGRWFDADARAWRDDQGAIAPDPTLFEVALIVVKRVVLAACHVNHDRANCSDNNLAGWCGRCHLRHDKPEHLRQRRLTYRARRALGDLFEGPYAVA